MTETTKTQTSASHSDGAHTTRPENAERGFVASKTLADNLQKVLIDLLELQIQGKQAHWNVVGKNFRDTHLILDEVVEAAREFSDTVAERLRALHASPDGRSETIAATTSLTQYPKGEVDTSQTVDLMTDRLEATIAMIRGVHDAVDEEDPTSADVLHAILERLEQLAWLVSAENRTPTAGQR